MSYRLLAIGVIIVAFVLRFWAVDWQLPHRFHPDEGPHVEIGLRNAVNLRFESDYINQPPLFRNILTVVFLGLARIDQLGAPREQLAEIMLLPSSAWPDELVTRIYLVSRVTVALFGGATVLLLMLAARALLGTPAALLAGSALALSLGHLRESHFALTTVPGLFFATAALYLSAAYVAHGGVLRLLASLLMVGLAMATRDLFIVTMLIPVAGLLAREIHVRRYRRLFIAGGAAVLVLAVMVGIFALVTPYVQFTLARGLSALPKLDAQQVSGVPAAPAVLVYPMMLAQSLGAPFALLAVLGLLVMLWRAPASAVVYGVPFVATLAMLGIHNRFWVRFGIPLEPYCAIFGAYGLWWLLVSTRLMKLPSRLRLAAGAAVLALPLINALVWLWVMTQSDTRILASAWVSENLPASSHVRSTAYALPRVSTEQAVAPPDGPARSFTWFTSVNEDVPGVGCGEVVALSSLVVDAAPPDERAAAESVRSALRQRGTLIARFAPGRNATEVPFSAEDALGPYWNIWQWRHPGPQVELYELSPSCERSRAHLRPADLLAVADNQRGVQLGASLDPRFSEVRDRLRLIPASVPREPKAAAVGRFMHGLPDELVALYSEERGRSTLELFRLRDEVPPQLVLEIIDPVGCTCVLPHGLGVFDWDQDGVDELLALEQTADGLKLQVRSLRNGEAVRVASLPVPAYEGQAPIALARVPADAGTAAVRLAFLYKVGGTLAMQMLEPTWPRGAAGEWPDRNRAFYRLPVGDTNRAGLLAVDDYDGDGRNDLAVLDTKENEARLYRLPTQFQRGTVTTMTHFESRSLPTGALMLAPIQPLARPASALPPVASIERFARDLFFVGSELEPDGPLAVRSTWGERLEMAERNAPLAAAMGRFTRGDAWPSLVVLSLDGRQARLELQRFDASGNRREPPVLLEQWRFEQSMRPFAGGLSPVDIDGDGVDELAWLRPSETGPELLYFRVPDGQGDELVYLESTHDVLTGRASLLGTARVPAQGGRRDQLIVLGQTDAGIQIEVFEPAVVPDKPVLPARVWRGSLEGSVVGVSAVRAGPEPNRRIMLTLRTEDGRMAAMGTVDQQGVLTLGEARSWPSVSGAVLLSVSR